MPNTFDLSDITRALGEAESQASLVELVQGYLGSTNASVRDTAVDALLEVLDEGDVDDRRAALLEDAALSYTPLLLPVDTAAAARLLALVARHASAREMTLALNEALQNLEEAANGVEVSDDEGDFDSDVDYGKLARQLRVVLELYAETIPRLTQAKSTPTLLSMADALSALQPLSFHTSSDAARALLVATCELVERAWAWSKTREDVGGGQRSILAQIVDQAVTLLGPRVDADLTGRAFLAAYPKYAGMYSVDAPGLPSLERALQTARTLGMDLDDALVQPASPFASVAALILLATAAAPPPPSVVPVLTAALGSACVDAGLALCFSLPDIDFDAATLLLELLAPLAAMSPSPLTRLAISKLLDAIPARFTGRDHVLLLLQLLEPGNPYDGVRLLALSILRAHLGALLIPDTVELLAPVVFAVPDDAFDAAAEPDARLAQLVWLAECANVLWLMLDLDKGNASGVRDKAFLQMVKERFLDAAARGVATMQRGSATAGASDGEDERFAFALERLADATGRAETALAGAA